MDVGDSLFNFDRVGNDAWNTGGTREIAITLDNGKLQLVERDENPLKYSSLNLLEKVKFNSGGRVVAGSNPVTPTDERLGNLVIAEPFSFVGFENMGRAL